MAYLLSLVRIGLAADVTIAAPAVHSLCWICPQNKESWEERKTKRS
jgi:hypothetical protein